MAGWSFVLGVWSTSRTTALSYGGSKDSIYNAVLQRQGLSLK